MSSIERVAIIGAGSAGLVAAKELLKSGLRVTIYEKNDFIGGIWKYQPGKSIMYGSLRTNLPKEIMAYDHEHPFKEYRCDVNTGESHGIPSFITYREVMEYLEDFADQYQLRDHILFETEVIAVSRNEDVERSEFGEKRQHDGKRWTVEFQHTSAQSHPMEDHYDAVVVCNGHFNGPYIPHVSGYCENFSGEKLHSFEYERVKPFLTNRKILVVGTKSSGTDMARELSQQGGNEIIVSDRNFPSSAQCEKHGNITIYPSISSFEPDGKSVLFKNGQVVSDFDTVLWCTGFKYSYPFLEAVDIVHIENYKRIRPLYEHLFAIEDNTLTFVGLPFTVVPFIIFSLQCKWIAKVFSGQVSLPNKAGQYSWLEKEEAALRDKCFFEEKYHFMGMGKQWVYDRQVVKAANLQDPLLSSYLKSFEEIYDDTVVHRPVFTGATDSYRSREYRINRLAEVK